MSKRRGLTTVLVVAGLALAVFALVRTMRGTGEKTGATPIPVDPTAQIAEMQAEAAAEVKSGTSLTTQSVLIFYPAANATGLVGEQHEIFHTANAGDRAKQIVVDLISGPTGELTLRAVPPGTRLRQIYVLDDGTAFVDFSVDLRDGISGGSMEEMLTIYSIVDSVALNVAEIQRVGILIGGQAIDTLNGHLDLRHPLPPDLTLIVDEEAVEEPAPRSSRRRPSILAVGPEPL